MQNYVNRPIYLERLRNRRDNGEVKIITGPRRAGKSWLLHRLYRDWLIGDGVAPDNIVSVSLDLDSLDDAADLRNPAALKAHLLAKMPDPAQRYYVFLDEVQEVEGFERIVNALNAKGNVDVYITGSNSRFLSSDINTIFRGRGDEVRIFPLTFGEFCSRRSEPVGLLWKEYYTYGGMPALLSQPTEEQKINYLQRLWSKTYIDDVAERNGVRNRAALEALVNALCSAVGSLTNPSRIVHLLQDRQRATIDSATVANYLRFLENAFLFEGANRYDVKGNKYYDSIKKYYACDVGLRNARLNFRQQEPTHLMENILYNELRVRGFLVDVGVVNTRRMQDGRSVSSQLEIDFIATNGRERYYIQSAYAIADDRKREQELQSFRHINDSFRKVIIVGSDIAPYTDNNGYRYLGLFDYLLGRADFV